MRWGAMTEGEETEGGAMTEGEETEGGAMTRKRRGFRRRGHGVAGLYNVIMMYNRIE
jgi:hypothetical protein